MKIGIDISQSAHAGTGVARYTKNLVHALTHYDKKNEYIFLYYSARRSVPHEISSCINYPHRLVYLTLPPTFMDIMWNRLHIASVERITGMIDIFISSDWIQPPTYHAKSYTIVHDLVVFTNPETTTKKTIFTFKDMNVSPNIVYTQKRRLQWVKKECDIIITDSHATRADIISLLQIPENKIRVVYPSLTITKPTQRQRSNVRNKYGLKKPFILSVGKREPRKNIRRLIEAYLSCDYTGIDLVIVGIKGWGEDYLQNNPSIKYLGFVEDQDLYSLYAEAMFFIMPSLYEGFGYPVVEAMHLDCPVTSSNTSSLKELVEDVGLLFDPYDTNSIAKAIKTLTTQDKLRTSIVSQQRNQIKKYSPQAFARNFVKTFT